jgi:hypothetical protein
MRKRLQLLLFLSLAVLCAMPLLAGTTGKLSGNVLDEQKQPLPGATVTVTSAVLIGGKRVAVTDVNGLFSFPALDPGVYGIRIELSGFLTQERSELQVRLDRTTEIDVTMPMAKFGEAVTVTAETPVVDPTQVSTSQTFTSDMLKTAALGSNRRSYQSVLSMAPGVVGSGNPSVYGSTSGENAYYVDGLDTTDPVTATFGTNFNFDAIQEISLQTGGYEAEFGRATGGIVNLVTKSGGNNFSGTFDIRYRDTSFYQNGDHFNRNDNKTTYMNPSATIGGPIIKDKVWFFVSGQYIDSQGTPAKAPTTRKYLGENYIGKVTWQLSDNWRITAKLSGDPARIDNTDASQFVAPEANTRQDQGGSIYQAELAAVLSPSLLWNTQVGINRSNLDAYPQSGDFKAVSHYNQSNGTYYGGESNAQYSDRNRDELKTNMTKFVDQFGGSHEFKGGIEYANLFFSSHNYTTAGGYAYTDILSSASKNVPYVMWNYTDPGTIDSKGKLYTAYLQDAWKPNSYLTIKGGFRYDAVSYTNNESTKIADMNKLQPRIGLAWDVTQDAKTLVKGSWGRFMHPNALTMPDFAKTALSTSYRWRSCTTLRGFTSAAQCQAYATPRGYKWQAGPDGWDAAVWYQVPSADVFGSLPNEIAKDLKPTYADELIVGIEREIARRTSIELSYVKKNTKDIFEDTCNGNLPTPNADAACDYYVMANLPGLKRDYTGYIFKLESRATDWLYILTSYTYSTSKGNVEYTQNAGTDFDVYPVHYVNRYGYLSDDRRHRVKLNGYVMLPANFTVGVDGYWSSAFAYSKTTAGDPYGTEYLEPRGSYRANDNWNLDLSLSWKLNLGALRTEIIGVVYNVFGQEQVNGVCGTATGCGTYTFGQATSWATPRRFEVGFRIEF